jgi:hypothetical protein
VTFVIASVEKFSQTLLERAQLSPRLKFTPPRKVKNEGNIMSGHSRPSGNRWHRRLDGEPSIKELLDDPVIEAVMARDGVRRNELEHLILEVRDRLATKELVAG